jgi:hypothetical protein
MKQDSTLTNIISNALNKGYTADQAVADLEKLMNEATLIEFQYGQESPRFIELKRLILVQKKLVKAKLEASPIFEQLGTLKARPHTDN